MKETQFFFVQGPLSNQVIHESVIDHYISRGTMHRIHEGAEKELVQTNNPDDLCFRDGALCLKKEVPMQAVGPEKKAEEAFDLVVTNWQAALIAFAIYGAGFLSGWLFL